MERKIFIFSIVILGMIFGNSSLLLAKEKPKNSAGDTLCPKGSDARGMFHADRDGNPLYPDKKIRFKDVGDFHEGAAWVLGKNGRYFFIDSTGKAINKKTYPQRPISGFVNGFAIVENFSGEYVLFVRKDGTQLPGNFFKVSPFREGLAAVENMDGLCFHIDTSGALAYKAKYQDVGDFHCGFAAVMDEKGDCFYIDKNNEPLRDGDGPTATVITFSKMPPDFDEQGEVVIENKKSIIKITLKKETGEVIFAITPVVKNKK
ncbi:WG repeat-containing protein [Patescibacteria group bacterium]|nr:WG repeat-containing protein [Patescibacteria group bacterium]MBU1727992.1 WG repeat-containing protein [Patescibacteria group bacterium]